MKIKTKKLSYDSVIKLRRPLHLRPKKPNIFFRTLVRVASDGDLKNANFTYTFDKSERERAGDGPYLILMNHSSFIDLEIVSKIFYPEPYGIVCTSDGFVGKSWLMRQIGCIPTNKFVSDLTLIRDMKYMLHDQKTSVLMYPEASYSFDGCATPLPRRLGNLFRMLDVPVLMVKTAGAFTRDPLYNCLQKRQVDVSAEVTCLFSRDELAETSVDVLDKKLDDAFTFDNFAWQRDNKIAVNEPFRADGLERIIYKCAACGCEGKMRGSGTNLVCENCGKTWELDKYGQLHAGNGGITEFSHIPDYYKWEREAVRREIENGEYSLDIPVEIGMLVDYRAIYMVGEGRLRHDENGFTLDGCEGKLHYEQSTVTSYSLYSDYFWYELGDMICIGKTDCLYYCFPTVPCAVAKTRIAVEELYKRKRSRKRNAADAPTPEAANAN